MQKIISLFKRDYQGTRQVYDEVVPGAEWVIAGEGLATEKFDGTACALIDGRLYKRYDCKKGRTAPEGFIPTQDPDPVTGHWPGWVAVDERPGDQWHVEALAGRLFSDGTYELVGPKVQGNPYGLDRHELWPHGMTVIQDAPRTFDALRDWFVDHSVEGIVWHHPDGRMVKIKRRDFGYSWPVK